MPPRSWPGSGRTASSRRRPRAACTTRSIGEALARGRRLSREQGIDAVLDRHRLDALVAPTGSPAWVTDLVDGDPSGAGSSTPAAQAGYPLVSVPAGFAAGLPVGITFSGGAFSEPALIRLAYAFERATGARRPPRFTPAVG
jgi:amidase